MIKINALQLKDRLEEIKKQNAHLTCFLLVGNEPYLQHEAQQLLLNEWQLAAITQKKTVVINNLTDWNSIFSSCQSLSLFSKKTLLILRCDDTAISNAIAEKLHELTTFLNEDIVLIITLNKLTKVQESSAWLSALSNRLLWINCQAPDTQHLPIWLKQQIKRVGIHLDNSAAELLFHYYEGNLFALSQLLSHLKILYPDKKILASHIENSINDSAIFSPYHWLDAILNEKTTRTLHILQQLQHNESEPLILLRTLQKELILLISLKKAMTNNTLKQTFDQYRVWQSRRHLYKAKLSTLPLEQLYEALNELTEIELNLKRDYDLAIWPALENLSLKLIECKLVGPINAAKYD